MNERMDTEYLGDGVYASHDEYRIWLDLRGQDSSTLIALEPVVFRALCKYEERIRNSAIAALAAGEEAK